MAQTLPKIPITENDMLDLRGILSRYQNKMTAEQNYYRCHDLDTEDADLELTRIDEAITRLDDVMRILMAPGK